MCTKIVLPALGLFLSTLAAGQDPGKDYDASVSLGFVNTSGNTQTSTFNTEALLTYRATSWTHNLKFQALGSQENRVVRAERYFLENKSDYNLGNDQYLFVRGSYTDDRFSGFEYQASVSSGYGRYLIRREDLELQTFFGAGYRQNDIMDAGNEGEGIFSLGESFSWQISDNSSLTQSFSSEIGNELTMSRFEIGLVTNIIGQVATKISFQARNTTKVPEGNKKTDTLTSVSLVYAF